MDLIEKEDSYCRICLKNVGFFDWSEQIFEFYGPTYRECYYKYIQLQNNGKKCQSETFPLDEEFSEMLCLDCGNGLRDIHQLVEKAIESTEKNISAEQCLICLKNEVFFEGNEAIFEFSGPTYKHCYYQYTQLQEREISNEVFCLDCGNTLRNIHQLKQIALKSYEKHKTGDKIVNNEDPTSKSIEQQQEEDKLNKPKRKRIKQPRMCAYCPHISYDSHHLRRHEALHTRTERNVECPKCSLKFYNEDTLKKHLVIHIENREPEYKCEFCPKGFYSSSGLIYHRRMHLGQVIKCQLCPKEYYRQIDLDRHMYSHNAATINKDTVKPMTKTKAFKVCNICGKTISREKLRDHMAMHSNEPKVECNICKKTYFNRKSMIRHIREVHNIKNAEEYNNYITTFDRKYKPRQSTLMKQQNIEID